jgi:predicted dehydrogenase
MEPVKAMLFGAGSRGMLVYAEYAKNNPQLMRISAIVEPNEERREKIQGEHSIPDNYAFTDYETAFANLPPVEAVIIATQDRLHAGPLVKALANNLHIICEKPVAPTPEECRSIEQGAGSFTRVFMTGYVLRFTPFFVKIKELLDKGQIGKLIGINMVEHSGYIAISNGFVRGHWRKLSDSSPMILAKCVHDMDMLYWLAGAKCNSLSSYGDLHYFKKENAPKDAPLRCLDGCPHMADCPWHVSKIYLTDNIGWPANVITNDLSIEGRIKALKEGPYGRCVFHCDNDVVDHQTVSMQFTNGISANFTMTGFTTDTHNRTLSLFGTNGEITGNLQENIITVKDFSSRNTDIIKIADPIGGHFGGDVSLIADFVRQVRDESTQNKSFLKDALEGHYMALAAEASRIANAKTIKLDDYKADKFQG